MARDNYDRAEMIENGARGALCRRIWIDIRIRVKCARFNRSAAGTHLADRIIGEPWLCRGSALQSNRQTGRRLEFGTARQRVWPFVAEHTRIHNRAIGRKED